MVRYTQPGIYCQCLKKLTTGTMSLSLTIWKLKPWHRLEKNLKKRYYTVKHGTLRALQEFADKHNVEVRREGEVKLCACTVRTGNGGRSSISKQTAFPGRPRPGIRRMGANHHR